MADQLTLDFKRGEQLGLLARISFGTGNKHNSRPISNSALKTVLKAVDDCIGSTQTEWVIPIARLMDITGLSKATVSAAIGWLADKSLLIVTVRHQVVEGRAVELPHKFRIVWPNVMDFEPARNEVVETQRAPAIVETEMGSLTMRRGSSHCETGVVSPCDGGSLTMRRGSSHHETVPVQSRPVPAHTSAPLPVRKTAGLEELQTQDSWAMPDSEFRAAVKTASAAKLLRMFDDAVRRGWLKGSEQARLQFVAACWDVCHSDVTSAIGCLNSRAKSKALGGRHGCSAEATEWARQRLRDVDHGPPAPRVADLLAETQPARRDVATQIAAIKAMQQQQRSRQLAVQ